MRPANQIDYADEWADPIAAHPDPTSPAEPKVPVPPPVEEPFAPRLDVVRLDAVQPERVVWNWDGRLPAGKVVTLDGDPGLGKSTVSLDMAAHISTGTPWPDGQPCPAGAVVVLSAEDGLADTIRPRIDAAGGDPSRVHAIRAVVCLDEESGDWTSRPLVIPRDLAQVEGLVMRVGARLVIVDVLMAYLDGRVNAHRDQDVRRALARLHALAENTGATVVILRHLNKGAGTSAMYRGGGSIGIVGAARVGLIVALDPDDGTNERRVLAVVKCNIARLAPSLAFRLAADPGVGTARVEWLGATSHTADVLVSERPDVAERSDRADAVQWLRERLADDGGSTAAAEMKREARQAGFSERTLDRARAEAGIRRRRVGFGKGSQVLWELPDESSTEPELPYPPHSPHTRHGLSPGDYDEYVAGMGDDPAPEHHLSTEPRCRECSEPLDAWLAAADPTYVTHPECDPQAVIA